MAEHHIPKGVSLDTLREIVAGWAAVGADEDPHYTSDVADATSVSDAVGRQTRFLEELGVLERHDQQHTLTDDGADLAGALAAGDDEHAREVARALLDDWALTGDVRGVLADNPFPGSDLERVVAALAGEDRDDSRVATGVSTLLDLYEWTGLLDRDADDRYALPAEAESAGGEGGGESAVATSDGGTDAEDAALAEGADVVEAVTRAAETTLDTGGGGVDLSIDTGAEAEETDTADGTPGESVTDAESPEVAARTAREAAAEAREAAREARQAAHSGGRSARGNATGETAGASPPALSLDLDLDANPEDLEAIIRGIRYGLTEDARSDHGE